MSSGASSYSPQSQTKTIEKPHDRPEGTGPFGATLKHGLLSKPFTHTQNPMSSISITKSDVQIKGPVDVSVIGKSVENKGELEFEIKRSETATIDRPDNATVASNSGPVSDAAPTMTATQCLIAVDIKTNGMKFKRG